MCAERMGCGKRSVIWVLQIIGTAVGIQKGLEDGYKKFENNGRKTNGYEQSWSVMRGGFEIGALMAQR